MHSVNAEVSEALPIMAADKIAGHISMLCLIRVKYVCFDFHVLNIHVIIRPLRQIEPLGRPKMKFFSFYCLKVLSEINYYRSKSNYAFALHTSKKMIC